MNISQEKNFEKIINQSFQFSWYDYLIFAFMLVLSMSVGIYYGCFGSKQGTVNRYLLGGKKMTAIPIAISVSVGHFSALWLTGLPADSYKFGIYLIFFGVSFLLMVILTIYLFYAIFFNLQITSTYEYLEKRFDQKSRMLASFLYIIHEIILLPIIAYAPSLALSTVCNIDVRIISAVICSICVFYTAIGGLKTVIWTDFYQFSLILTSLVLICGIGISKAGFLNIWNKAIDGGRLDVFDLDFDPTKRDSIWICLIGFTLQFTGFISLSQSSVQKFLSLPTFKDCVRSIIYFSIVHFSIVIICAVLALLMYEKYAYCDPLLSHKITKHEQMVPFYVMEVGGNYPGISGLFFVALVCAGLSSISSSLNALSGVIYKDFINTFLTSPRTDSQNVFILKIIVLILGLFSILCVNFMDKMGNLLAHVLSLSAVTGGPLLGMFTLGVLFPKANSKGSFYGALCGVILMTSLVVPSKYFNYDKMLKYPTKPLSTIGCRNMNGTNSSEIFENFDVSTNVTNIKYPPFLFRISPFYHCALGTFLTIILGLIVSYTTHPKDPPVDKNLLCPLGRYFVSEENKNETSKTHLLKKITSDNAQEL